MPERTFEERNADYQAWRRLQADSGSRVYMRDAAPSTGSTGDQHRPHSLGDSSAQISDGERGALDAHRRMVDELASAWRDPDPAAGGSPSVHPLLYLTATERALIQAFREKPSAFVAVVKELGLSEPPPHRTPSAKEVANASADRTLAQAAQAEHARMIANMVSAYRTPPR